MFRLLVLLCVVLMTSSASASGLSPWASASASWSTYSMSDVNDGINNVNTMISGSGLSMDEINSGFAFGFSGGIELENGLGLGVGYERLAASSDIGDFSGSLKYDFPANLFRILAHYTFPGSGPVLMHVGASTGIVSEAGSITLTVVGTGSASVGLDGSGPVAEFFAGADYWAAPQFAFTGSAGYRYAKVSKVEAQGQTLYNADGSEYSIDYSGLTLRLGIKVRGAR